MSTHSTRPRRPLHMPRVPCRKGCGSPHAAHQKANHHAKSSKCESQQKGPFQCPWKDYNGCNESKATREQLGRHAKSHKVDKRRPYVYQCDDCSVRHSDLYMFVVQPETKRKRRAGQSGSMSLVGSRMTSRLKKVVKDDIQRRHQSRYRRNKQRQSYLCCRLRKQR